MHRSINNTRIRTHVLHACTYIMHILHNCRHFYANTYLYNCGMYARSLSCSDLIVCGCVWKRRSDCEYIHNIVEYKCI